MSIFEVIFNKVEKFGSDINHQSNPTPETTVVAPLHQADIARVEAGSPEDAEAAVRVAYSGITSNVEVKEVPEEEGQAVVNQVPAEAAEQTDVQSPVEPTESEPVVTDKPVVIEPAPESAPQVAPTA